MSYSKPYADMDGATTAIIRARFQDDALHDVEELGPILCRRAAGEGKA